MEVASLIRCFCVDCWLELRGNVLHKLQNCWTNGWGKLPFSGWRLSGPRGETSQQEGPGFKSFCAWVCILSSCLQKSHSTVQKQIAQVQWTWRIELPVGLNVYMFYMCISPEIKNLLMDYITPRHTLHHPVNNNISWRSLFPFSLNRCTRTSRVLELYRELLLGRVSRCTWRHPHSLIKSGPRTLLWWH